MFPICYRGGDGKYIALSKKCVLEWMLIVENFVSIANPAINMAFMLLCLV